jgi:hypothetical protein
MAVFLRRRAERFAQLVDEAGLPGRGPHHHGRPDHRAHPDDGALAPLVTVGRQLHHTGQRLTADIRPSDAFRTALRQRLMETAAAEGIGDTARSPEPARAEEVYTPRWAPRRSRAKLFVAGGAMAGVLAISGVAAASTSAVPGDSLYDVKRSTEQAQIALAGSGVNSGQLYLQFARTRMSEAQAVATDPASLSKVLADMDSQTTQGVKLLTTAAVQRHDSSPLDLITGFTADQTKDMTTLLTGMGQTDRTRAEQSYALLGEVQQRASDLRAQLDCLNATGRHLTTDRLGPVPPGCSAMPAQPSVAPSGGSHPQESSPASRPTGTPKAGASGTPSPSPSGSGLLPGLNLPLGRSGSPSPSPSGGGSSDSGGLLGALGKLLGGLL